MKVRMIKDPKEERLPIWVFVLGAFVAMAIFGAILFYWPAPAYGQEEPWTSEGEVTAAEIYTNWKHLEAISEKGLDVFKNPDPIHPVPTAVLEYTSHIQMMMTPMGIMAYEYRSIVGYHYLKDGNVYSFERIIEKKHYKKCDPDPEKLKKIKALLIKGLNTEPV